jgi:FdhD protein
MRTPGQDEELAAGFLFSEGMLKSRQEVQALGPWPQAPRQRNVLNVELTRPAGSPPVMQRFGTISTSCGLCGKVSIDEIRSHFPPLPRLTPASLNVAVLLRMPDQLRQAQGNFARTGGLHAAGVFDLTGSLLVLREDVGRHNAADKAVGRLFIDGLLPLHQHVLLVSGRTSLEIVHKALAAGIPIVASVSAPSTLAVTFAREAGMTLIGFLRPPTFNVYAHVERLGPE